MMIKLYLPKIMLFHLTWSTLVRCFNTVTCRDGKNIRPNQLDFFWGGQVAKIHHAYMMNSPAIGRATSCRQLSWHLREARLGQQDLEPP